MTARRFLEQIRWYHPGRELVTEARLCPDKDPYLKDYIVCGDYVFPEVMAMEAISQVARVLVAKNPLLLIHPLPGKLRLGRFESVRFSQPLVMGLRGCILRCRARLTHADQVEVRLESSVNDFDEPFVTASCCFECDQDEHDEVMLSRAQVDMPMAVADCESLEDLSERADNGHYRFQCLKHFQQLSKDRCQAVLNSSLPRAWFSDHPLPEQLTLAQPESRQAAIDVLQACIPHLGLQPVGVESWHPGDLESPGPWILTAHERCREQGTCYYDVHLSTTEGQMREQWIGLQFKFNS